MSTPHSLAEAFRILRRRQNYLPQNEGSNVVDILGVVSNISTYSCSAFEITTSCRRRRSPHSQIWLTDDSQVDHTITQSREESLELFGRPSFVLYGPFEMARIDQEQIKVGDVIRFNRVTLKDSDGTWQFRFSSHDPEPGVRWFRLGHIDSEGSFNENHFEDYCSASSRIPESMKTSKKRLTELVEWYNYNVHRILPLSSSNAFLTRRRQLSEIEFTSGILSNIKVKVTQVRSEYVAVASSNMSRNKKRSKTLTPLVFAVFTDESETIIPFIDTSGRFLTQLRSAHNDNFKTLLVMTNVCTEYQSNLRGLESSTKEIVLVPTGASSGVLVSHNETPNRVNNSNTSDVSGVNKIPKKETSQDSNPRETTVISRMVDLTVDGISLQKNRSVFATSSKYLKTILGTNGRCFRTAMVDLDAESLSGRASRSSIEVTPDVLKTLCGSLGVDELSSDETLCAHSMGFLRGLIHEDIVLKWTLTEEENQKLTTVKAVLHRIP
eukprot:jgi/Psemu1/318371/estExt_fgenesh1_pm.C_690001